MFAIVERGARLRSSQAGALRAVVELTADGHPPVRIDFRGEQGILVADGPADPADVRIQGPLGEIVSLLTTPLLGGLPSPLNRRGRAAISLIRGRRVRVQGSLALMRRFLAVIRIEGA